IPHRHQQAAQFTFSNKLRDKQTGKQQKHADKIENILGAVATDIPAMKRAQISDSVYAAGVTLLTDNQNGENRSNGLGNNRKVNAADATLEHRHSNQVGKQAGNHNDGD